MLTIRVKFSILKKAKFYQLHSHVHVALSTANPHVSKPCRQIGNVDIVLGHWNIIYLWKIEKTKYITCMISKSTGPPASWGNSSMRHVPSATIQHNLAFHSCSCNKLTNKLKFHKFKQIITIHSRDDLMVLVIHFNASSHFAVSPQYGSFWLHLKHHIILVEICQAEWRLTCTSY